MTMVRYGLLLALVAVASACGADSEVRDEAPVGSAEEASLGSANGTAPADTEMIAAGDAHTCALAHDGTVRCWGSNAHGQLGDNTGVDRLQPTQVVACDAVGCSPLRGVTAISAGARHTCALTSDSSVYCWGRNDRRQAGVLSTTDQRAAQIVGNGARTLSCGGSHTCTVQRDGTVRCWGAASALGNGATADSWDSVTPTGLDDVVSLSAGGGHTCAGLADGSMRCWGRNREGQIGDGTVIDRPTPVTVPNVSFTKGVAAGEFHTCAVAAGGGVRCWGRNSSGQIGQAPAAVSSSSVPLVVAGVTGAVAISAGARHTCARRAAGEVSCWGSDGYGQLGDGVIARPAGTPGVVLGLSNVVGLELGGDHTCAQRADGTLRCWGYNASRQLGDQTATNRTSPVTVIGYTGGFGARVSLGLYHSCARRHDGTLRCWGDSGSGQIGDGTTTRRSAPVAVSGISSAKSIEAGGLSSCTLLAGGAVKCWGDNRFGQLGDGSLKNSSVPVTTGVSDVVDLDVGDAHACAVLADGTVRCWGFGLDGELGSGALANSPTPTPVLGVGNAVAVAAGVLHTCALLGDGTLRCWGDNSYGQLGDGTTKARSQAVAVQGLADVVAVSARGWHTCATVASGRMYCWGMNLDGQLGDGTFASRSTPGEVAGFPYSVNQPVAGLWHSCAVGAEGLAYCWGSNNAGQCGYGNVSFHATPTLVALPRNVAQMAVGLAHTCAVLGDGTLRCWGDNQKGQLGNNGVGSQQTGPVQVVSFP